jgi:acyl-coenzyme A synthetase/AMP-(fatty) acid ligase
MYTPVNTREDVATIFYTSGTASNPKGVVCTFGELYDNAPPTADAFGITAHDRLLDFRSFNWASAQILSALGTLCKGATLLLARTFSESHFFEWLQTHQATIAAGNPTTLNMLLNRPVNVQRADLPHLRFITSSSAPLLVQDWKRFEAMYGIPVAQGYGSSETGWIAGSSEHTRRLGSVGTPFPYQNVVVVNEAGEPLRPGEAGAIELRRSSDAEYRYLGDDGTIQVSAKGRIQTGDMGYFDPDGYLYITGRTKDLIIRGGVNIAPVEIDNIICELRTVAEAATVGVSDPIYGEEVITYVVPKPGCALQTEDVLAHCRTKLAAAKAPKAIIFCASLPKTERGKLDRNALAKGWVRTHRQ